MRRRPGFLKRGRRCKGAAFYRFEEFVRRTKITSFLFLLGGGAPSAHPPRTFCNLKFLLTPLIRVSFSNRFMRRRPGFFQRRRRWRGGFILIIRSSGRPGFKDQSENFSYLFLSSLFGNHGPQWLPVPGSSPPFAAQTAFSEKIIKVSI